MSGNLDASALAPVRISDSYEGFKCLYTRDIDITTSNDYFVAKWRTMMKTMPITDFKSHALKVLSHIATHKENVVVTKRGKPLAVVVPYNEPEPSAGRLAETLVFEKDIIKPFGDTMWDACK